MVTEGTPPSKPDHAQTSQPQPKVADPATRRVKVASALERIVGEEAGVLERLKDA